MKKIPTNMNKRQEKTQEPTHMESMIEKNNKKNESSNKEENESTKNMKGEKRKIKEEELENFEKDDLENAKSVEELKTLFELRQALGKSEKMGIYFYSSENEESIKYLKTYNEIFQEICKKNSESKISFWKEDLKISQEIFEQYYPNPQIVPCIYIFNIYAENPTYIIP